VPDDADVRAASRLLGKASDKAPKRKRHHYIAQTYMDGFSGPEGRLWAYYLDNPSNPRSSRPEAIAYSNYYYSQIRPDGTRDDDSFEDLWGAIETVWPETMRAVAGGRVSLATSFNVLGMVAITSVRVPAARQRNELLLAADLRAKAMGLERFGALPDDLQRYAGELDTIPVGINPQQSIPLMMENLRQFGDLCFKMGFEILHNETDLPFITSDNPVCLYDPRTPAARRRPYEYDGQAELICPLNTKMVLRGSSRLRPVDQIVRHGRISDRGAVTRINNTIARFAYGLALAQDRTSDGTIALHAAACPTVSIKIVEKPKGADIVWRHKFGPRPKLAAYIDTPAKAARLEAELAAAKPKPDLDDV